jgi:hypothetical protein
MDLIHDTKESNKKTFLSHVFSTTEEGKAEILNVLQYAMLAIIPVIALNKTIQRFVPEADGEKSTLELLVEIFIQLTVMFCGIVIIHRVVTFVPTYSGFIYDNLQVSNSVIITFLIIVLSIQTKLGIKVNILIDRLSDLWNGTNGGEDKKTTVKNGVRVNQPMARHSPSQADNLDNSQMQNDMFPPAPVATMKSSSNGTYDNMMRGNGIMNDFGPAAANGVLGGAFGSAF